MRLEASRKSVRLTLPVDGLVVALPVERLLPYGWPIDQFNLPAVIW